MRRYIESIKFGLILFATMALPQTIFMITGATSTGVFIVSAFYLILFIALSAIRKQPNFNLNTAVLLSLIIVFTHGVINSTIYTEFDYDRFFASYLLLILFIFGATSFIFLVQQVSQFNADLAVKFVFYGLLISSVAGIIKFSPFSTGQINKPVLFFNEPSSYALGFAPFLLYMVVMSGFKMRLLWIFMAYLIAFFLESLTLIIATTFIVLFFLPLRRFFLLLPVLAMVFLLSSLDVSYYTSRTKITEDNENLSSLVYASGWERARLSLENTFGLGTGFQQFGILGQQGSLMDILDNLGAGGLNRLNGGSVAPKFIGEFGVVGVFIIFVYLAYFVKYFKWLRKVCLARVIFTDKKTCFFISCFLTFSLDLFVRGSGYFCAEGFMFLASLIFIKSSSMFHTIQR